MYQLLAIVCLTCALTLFRGTFGGPSPFFPGRVGHWSFAYSKGRDLSNYGNNVNRDGTIDFDGHNGLFFPSGSNQYVAEIGNVNKDVNDLGKYSGFSVFGYVRYTGKKGPFSIVDFRAKANDYGLRIWGDANTSVWLNLGANSKNVTLKQAAGFPNMTLLPGEKRHFGVSYNKASGKVVGFMNGNHQNITIGENISAYTNVDKIYFGHQQGDHRAFKGNVYCMMFYRMALTAAQFLKLVDRCDINKDPQTEQVKVYGIGVTEATIEPGVPINGVFDHCNTTLEIKEGAITNETVFPNSFLVKEPSETSLTKLTPGAFYRVVVQCVFGGLKGEALTSTWFQTDPVKEAKAIPERVTKGTIILSATLSTSYTVIITTSLRRKICKYSGGRISLGIGLGSAAVVALIGIIVGVYCWEKRNKMNGYLIPWASEGRSCCHTGRFWSGVRHLIDTQFFSARPGFDTFSPRLVQTKDRASLTKQAHPSQARHHFTSLPLCDALVVEEVIIV